MGSSAENAMQSAGNFFQKYNPVTMAYDAYKGNASPAGALNPFTQIGNYMGWGSAQGGPIQGTIDNIKQFSPVGMAMDAYQGKPLPGGGFNPLTQVGNFMGWGGAQGGPIQGAVDNFKAVAPGITNPFLSKIIGGSGQPQTQPVTQGLGLANALFGNSNSNLLQALMGGGSLPSTGFQGGTLSGPLGGMGGGGLGAGGLSQPNPMGQVPFDSTFMDDFIPKNQSVNNTPMGNPLQGLGAAFGQPQPQPTTQAFTPPSGWSQADLAGTATTPETTQFPAMGTPAQGQAVPGGGLFTPEQMKAMFGV